MTNSDPKHSSTPAGKKSDKASQLNITSSPAESRASDNNQPRTRLDAAIIKLGDLVSLIFLASACIIIYEIAARYLFNAPTIWVHETTTLLCALCFVYGGSYCLGSNRHIRIGILYDVVSARFRHILDVFIAFFSLVYVLVLSWAAYTVAKNSLFAPWGDFRMETSGSAWDPALPAIVKTFLFCVLVLMSVQFLLQLIKLVSVGHQRDSHDV